MAAVAISDERWELALIELGGAIVSRFTTTHGGDWPQVRRAVRRRLTSAAGLRQGGRPEGRGRAHRGGLRVGAGHGERAAARPGAQPELGGHRPGRSWSRGRACRGCAPSRPGNDASLAGLGEARRGSSAGARTVVHLHMDNGIGGALLLDGRPVAGAQGLAGEFGHMPFGPRGRRCPCGASGCWNTGLDGAALAAGLGVALPADEVSFTVRVLARAAAGRRGRSDAWCVGRRAFSARARPRSSTRSTPSWSASAASRRRCARPLPSRCRPATAAG